MPGVRDAGATGDQALDGAGVARGRLPRPLPSYVRLLLSTLPSVLGAAAEDGFIVTNPCRARSVKAPPVPPGRTIPWMVEQVRAVIAAHPYRYRALPVVDAGCGLRQGEAFGLRVEDVDLLARVVHVRQQVKHLAGQGVVIAPPKRGRTRTCRCPMRWRWRSPSTCAPTLAAAATWPSRAPRAGRATEARTTIGC